MTTFLMISGWGAPGVALHPLATRLGGSASDACLSVHDLPTHAGNTEIAGMSSYATGLIALLDRLPEPCVLLGWSMGGIVALEAAAARPDCISRLVLCASTAKFVSGPGYAVAVPPSEMRAFDRGLRHAARATLEQFHQTAARPRKLEPSTLEERVGASLRFGDASLTQGLAYLRKADHRPVLDKIHVPTLVLHGQTDAVIPVSAGLWLAEHLPDAQCEILAGHGHDLPREVVEDIALRIQAFITI